MWRLLARAGVDRRISSAVPSPFPPTTSNRRPVAAVSALTFCAARSECAALAPHYCASILASRFALPHFAVSTLLRCASASGVPGSMVKPVVANLSCRSLACAAALIAWLSLATVSGGVPGDRTGSTRVHRARTSAPGQHSALIPNRSVRSQLRSQRRRAAHRAAATPKQRAAETRPHRVRPVDPPRAAPEPLASLREFGLGRQGFVDRQREAGREHH